MKPNLLWLHSDRAGCGSYRCYVPGLTLQDLGYDSHFLQHMAVPFKGFADLADMHLVIFQRAVATRFLAWMDECKTRGIPTVWEADDDVFNIPKANPSAPYWHRKEVQALLVEALEKVDHILVSTMPLKHSLIEHGAPATKITVCPNFLHPNIWGPGQTGLDLPRFANTYGDRAYTVIGWQGSNTHDADFKTALPALRRVLDARPDVIIRFFGNVPQSVRGVIPESRFQWAKGVIFEQYPSHLAYMHFDIGLAPITDSRFNTCKSNLKWLEYSSIGVPTIASTVYPYSRSIVHGDTGLLAATEQEWYDALIRLVDNPSERLAMGARAKAHVWEKWSTTHIHAWDQVFRRLLGEAYGEQLLSGLMGVERLRAFGAFTMAGAGTGADVEGDPRQGRVAVH